MSASASQSAGAPRSGGYGSGRDRSNTEDPWSVIGRAMEQVESLRQSAEAAARESQGHREACDRMRQQLRDEHDGLRLEREKLATELTAMQKTTATAKARAREAERKAALARQTRDEAFSEACRVGGQYAALKAEAAWLRQLIAQREAAEQAQRDHDAAAASSAGTSSATGRRFGDKSKP
eukprot:TRINITY_DN41782_c0_g1_i1.p1 TRINITY_DN41782_c0_g1~~TRINITY_DN41782_c0_g1_i1.p1  ORF type:complete len:180 (-),score=47.28 TRINITY_DN41782_c0_g1_i1:49-588(-)